MLVPPAFTFGVCPLETKKRTVSLDASDEQLIARIVEKNRPFASAHAVARAAIKCGLRVLAEDAGALRDSLEPISKAGKR